MNGLDKNKNFGDVRDLFNFFTLLNKLITDEPFYLV